MNPLDENYRHAFTTHRREREVEFSHDVEVEGRRMLIGTILRTCGVDGQEVPMAWEANALCPSPTSYSIVRWADERIFPERNPTSWLRTMVVCEANRPRTGEDYRFPCRVADVIYPDDADTRYYNPNGVCAQPLESYLHGWEEDYHGEYSLARHRLNRLWRLRSNEIEQFEARNKTSASKVLRLRRKVERALGTAFANPLALESEIATIGA